jgi:uncharacterized protein YecE (DUF72 family)
MAPPARTGKRSVRVGCSGWSYDAWRGVLYPPDLPESRWLERYAEEFDTVEINATFYRLPTGRMVQRWADATPPGFTFSVKASRYLTHVRRLKDVGEGVARLRGLIEPLAASGKLGPILWQLPAQFLRDDERLATALTVFGPGRNAVEFRHPSWFCDDVMALLREHGVAAVIPDSRARPLPEPPPTTDWSYIRLHDGRGRRGRYSDSQLREWSSRLAHLPGDGYVYFNNDWEGFAVENGRFLLHRLHGS